MSGIPEEHRPVVCHLLNYLPDDDVMSLAATVSRGMVKVSGVDEAKNAILSFSESVESLLKRKKMKQEYLVRFLWDQQISMPEGTDKPLLVSRFLRHLHEFNTASARDTPSGQQVSAPSGPPPADPGLFNAAFVDQFVPWFVDKFNGGADLSPHHFWADCALQVVVRQRGGGDVCLDHAGAEETAGALRALQTGGLRLVATPLREPGAASASVDGFGRVTVTFRGCVHHRAAGGPVGLFQQTMGLIQDVPSLPSPAAMLYKVKFLRLEVESQLPPDVVCGAAIAQ